MRISNTLFKAGLFLILLLITGCFPGVTWLPDSSGFVYTTADRSLVHFDVAKGQKRVIVKDTETGTVWPAVSPDGKHVAVARVEHKKGKPDILQIIVYDLTGKVTQRSVHFVFSPARTGDKQDLGSTVLFWRPLNNQIIVGDYISDEPNCGIYDVEANRLSIVPGHPAAFAGNPIRPDGNGFLVSKAWDEGINGMSFIDRQGKEHPIALKPPALESKDNQQMLACPFLFSSSWAGNKAVVFNSKGRFEIDTDKYIGQFISSPQAQAKTEGETISQFTFPNSSKVVQVVEISNQQGEAHCRLEIFDSKEKKASLIQKARAAIIYPSPNRKLVAVRCDDSEVKEENQRDRILVINQQGEVVARIAAR